MKPKTIVHLLSGGLDSVTLLYDLKEQGHKIHCLMFDYGQQHVQELTFAKLHCRRLSVMFTTMQLPKLGGLNEKSWIVPNRNAIFLSVAVNFALQSGFEAVAIGCNQGDAEYFPDCRKQFIDAMNKAVKSAGYDVEILSPYLDKTKKHIALLALERCVPMNEIWTCYRGGAKPCGQCPACLKLEEACGQ